jgi:predicted phage tail protein
MLTSTATCSKEAEVKQIAKQIEKLVQRVLGDKEPALVGGLIGAAAMAAVLALTGSFADGVSAEELGLILGPLGLGGVTRFGVYSPRSAGHARK